jgi:hypothetical protein
MKASTGPVPPMMVRGCAEVSAYNTPDAAVETSISMHPIEFPVTSAYKPPKPIAGARQAKNMNIVAAMD